MWRKNTKNGAPWNSNYEIIFTVDGVEHIEIVLAKNKEYAKYTFLGVVAPAYNGTIKIKKINKFE